MSIFRKIIVIAFLVIFISQANASVSGEELLSACQAFLTVTNGKVPIAKNAVLSGVCVGYIEGIADFQDYLLIANSQSAKEYMLKKGLYCPPTYFTTSRAAQVIVKYLANNPKNLNLPAAPLVLSAFANAFPCK
jgi:hypothetical protein